MDTNFDPIKVYISSFSNVDYTHLEEFGQVIREPITAGFIDLTNLRKFYEKVRPIVERIRPEDFLALSGTCVVGVLLSQFLLNRNGVVRLLSFDRNKGANGGYREVVMTNTQLIPDDAQENNA